MNSIVIVCVFAHTYIDNDSEHIPLSGPDVCGPKYISAFNLVSYSTYSYVDSVDIGV